jgi:exodeoxyribonuclease V gamma subunit
MKATYYSNFIKNLLENLKENIFFKNSKFSSYIFVPNKFVKNWLMKKFCDNSALRVCFGIKFITFNNFLNFVQNSLAIPKEKRFLNFLELNLIIREKINSYLSENSSKFDFLRKYLIKNGKTLEKRFIYLCEELTEIFLDYAIFGNFEDLNVKRKKYWQASLFYDIFYKDGYSLAFRDLSKFQPNFFNNFSFHFFIINYIPPLYFDFISKFSNVFHYINSPCQVYWEDIVSDYERGFLKRGWLQKNETIQKIDEVDNYLKDTNSFLANMERLKRNYLKIISNYENFQFFENFSKENKNTFLSLFKNDILFLENRNENNYGIVSKEDDSFQIHVTTNRFREIQVLHLNILNILNSNDDIDLSDIHVIAPNIDEYFSYIHMIFNDGQNPLNYKISDLTLAKESHLISGLEKLFSLANSRWEKSDIMDLFENPLFQKKNKISKDELSLLFDLIEKANISFGLDEKYISEENNIQAKILVQRSWDKGLARILFGMVFILNDDFIDKSFLYDYPIAQLDMTSTSSIIDKFLEILFNIIEDLKVIENETLLSLKEWRLYFQKIIDKYFLIDENFTEKSTYDVCFGFFEDLKKIFFRFEKNTYLFEVIFSYFKKYVSRNKTNFNPNDEQAIHFSSFAISALPAKVVFIIGLDSKAIRLNPKNSLDFIENDFFSKSDLNRSLFLETMLSAQRYLILSFATLRDYKADASIAVQELLFYLDSSYKIMGKKPSEYIIKRHPSFSFHESYFSEDNKSFSKIDFLVANAYYSPRKKIRKEIEANNIKNLPDIIDIRSLRDLCKNPIKFYLNKGLKIYIEEKKSNNEFNFSFLNKYIFKKESFKNEIENILFSFEKRADIPYGIFYEIEKQKIIKETNDFHKNLKDLGIDNFITVEFCLDVKKPIEIFKNYIQLPAIEVQVKDRKIKLIGKLKNITSKGLLVDTKDDLSGILKIFSDLLIYYKLDKVFTKQIIFSKTLKVKSFDLRDLNRSLADFICYYFVCLDKPSFIMKPFIDPILKLDEEALNKAVNRLYEENNLIIDNHIKWFFLHCKMPCAKEIIDQWSKYFNLLFKPILEEI